MVPFVIYKYKTITTMKAKRAAKNFLKRIQDKSNEEKMDALKNAPIEIQKELLHEFDVDDIPTLTYILTTKTIKL